MVTMPKIKKQKVDDRMRWAKEDAAIEGGNADITMGMGSRAKPMPKMKPVPMPKVKPMQVTPQKPVRGIAKNAMAVKPVKVKKTKDY